MAWPLLGPAAAADESAIGGYAVQVGAFGERANAEKMLSTLSSRLSGGRLLRIESEGVPLYLVVNAVFTEKAAARHRATLLERLGLNTYVRSLAPAELARARPTAFWCPRQ